MKIASAFLSHASEDKRRVRELAAALGRHGVVAWVDEQGLARDTGQALHKTLKKAIDDCTVTVVLLSSHTRDRPWIEREVEHALGQCEVACVVLDGEGTDARRIESAKRVFPPLAHQIGDRTHLTEVWRADDAESERIAERIAQRIFKEIGVLDAPAVTLYLDQRGAGEKRANEIRTERVPSACHDHPILVFRPDRQHRRPDETLTDTGWVEFSRPVDKVLRELFGQRRPTTVHVCGDAQLGLPFLIGRILDRRSRFPLVVHGVDGLQYCWSAEHRNRPTPVAALPSRVSGATNGKADLVIGERDYLDDVRSYRESDERALYWIDPGEFVARGMNEKLATLAGQIRAVREAHKDVRFFNCLSFGASCVVAARLETSDTLRYFEFRRDRATGPAGGKYVELTMPEEDRRD